MEDIQVKECIGCGFCCHKTKCAAGQRLYPGAEVCPALEWNGTRHNCKLMQVPGVIGEQYRKELYAGEGCCANLNSWRYEPLKDRTELSEAAYKNPIPTIMQRFLAALGREMISGDSLYMLLASFKNDLEQNGMSDHESSVIAKNCMHYITQNRSNFTTNFMG